MQHPPRDERPVISDGRGFVPGSSLGLVNGSGIKAVLLTGVYGSGKSTVAKELAYLLEQACEPYALLDLDYLSWGGAGTQLGSAYSRADATRIVSEWCRFFSKPSPILELHFTSRTPKRLFEALTAQSQLRRLGVKWGDYKDLQALVSMDDLIDLTLGGASGVRSLEPLARLRRVERLHIESLRHVRDLSPLSHLTSVTDLEVGGDWRSPRIAHVNSIAFLADMPQLRNLVIHSIIVDSLDYSPLLRLPHLKTLRVMKARGMTPRWEELAESIPALQRRDEHSHGGD
jgi:hypothetical protein